MGWDNTYENTPLNGDDPGEGALELRTLKGEISKRGSTEHYWGEDEENLAPRLGAHKEGSARVTVIDEYPDGTNREDPSENLTNTGSVTVNYTDQVTPHEIDGVTVSAPLAEEGKDITLKVRAYDDPAGTAVTAEIYNKAYFLNLLYDQIVGGRKEFQLNPKVPKDPAIDIGGSPYGLDWFVTQMDSAGSGADVAVTLSNARDNLKASMLGNSLDPLDAQAQWLDNQSPGYITGEGYVNRTVKVTEVIAESLTGAVWV